MDLPVSEKYGVNPSVVICPCCGTTTNEIALVGKVNKYRCGCGMECFGRSIRGRSCPRCARQDQWILVDTDVEIPMEVPGSEPCEYCSVAVVLIDHPEGMNKPMGGVIGVAKIVNSETRELVAYVPFESTESRDTKIGDTKVIMRHGMEFMAKMEDDKATLTSIWEPGVLKLVKITFEEIEGTRRAMLDIVPDPVP